MHTNLPIPKHKLIGHRGVAGLRPENTYTSFKYAAQLDLDWIEFDVQLTKDDNWVVMHDERIDRTTNGKGLVKDHSLEELLTLEAGLWFKPPYPGEKIPTLIGTLQLARELKLYCNIEIKNPESDPLKHARLFAAFTKQNHALVNHSLASSFDVACLIQLRHELPTFPIGYIVEAFTPDTIPIALEHEFFCVNCDVKKITEADLTAARKANIPIYLYTVNDPVTAKFWLDKGVTGIFTNRPDKLLEL